MKQGKIIILSGPSGVGKGTVLKEVMRGDPSLRFSVSATTRPIRPGEVDGVHYFFMDKPRFEKMIADGELLEYASYAGNYYGTPEKAVDEETVRLRSHLAQMEKLLCEDGSVGRKLDFLLQEMNREANTIGSKGNDIEQARNVVEIKAELEKIREQIQNIE